MKQKKTSFMERASKHSKKIWCLNILMLIAVILIQTPGSFWLMSISQGTQAKAFQGAMMPLAFVPDWQKSDYIDKRGSLDYSFVSQNDLLPLPRIEDVNTDFNSHFTYLTMFMGKYMDEDRKVGVGSHDGVDIRAPLGTPVFAIANGKVVKVRDDANNKYITVEHRDVKYQGKVGKYYSSYLHLSRVSVSVGDVIDKGTIIGRVGMTGFTTTPHLHIQVDNEDAPFIPYWPFGTEEANDAGLSISDAVDAGLNRDQILKYSVNPIDFIKRATPIDGAPLVAQTNTSSTSGQSITVSHSGSGTTATTVKPVIATTPIPVVIAGNGTNDITYSSPYYNSVSYLKRAGIIQGNTDGKFHPEKNLSRAEMLSVIIKAMKANTAPKGEVFFSDVSKSDWWYDEVTMAVKNGWITSERKKFEPNRAVSRIEFMTVLARISGEKLSPGIRRRWTDLSWNDPLQKYAQFSAEMNLMDGVDGKKFNPNKPLTRAEAAEAVYRYLKAKNKL